MAAMPASLPSSKVARAPYLSSRTQPAPATAKAPTRESRIISRRRSAVRPPQTPSQTSIKPSRWRKRLATARAATSRAAVRGGRRASRSHRAAMPASIMP